LNDTEIIKQLQEEVWNLKDRVYDLERKNRNLENELSDARRDARRGGL
jgi:predicted RNase H-like nuclease (RuvC/YqgF family)